MKRRNIKKGLFFLLFLFCCCYVSAQDEEEEDLGPTIKDPLISWNRVVFNFNDKLYFSVLKPVAVFYGKCIPQKGRLSVRNFFDNLTLPVRFVNCVLQGKLKSSGIELSRFAINTTLGFLGLFDPAKKRFNLVSQEEDLGQTFGNLKLGHGFYLVLPFLGPSSLRDSLGLLGDGFLTPIYYLPDYSWLYAKTGVIVNQTSLKIGDYEDLKKSSLDPYLSFRDIYVQYRENEQKK